VKIFLVDVLMTGYGLGVNSNCFVGLGDEPSPTSDSFSLVTLGNSLVVGFFGGIVSLSGLQMELVNTPETLLLQLGSFTSLMS
jgi:hypothetical protein